MLLLPIRICVFYIVTTILLTSCNGAFDSTGLRKLTFEEISANGVKVDNNVPAYNDKGKRLKAEDLITHRQSDLYLPQFYVDEKGALKAIVYESKSSPVKATNLPDTPMLSFVDKVAPDMELADISGQAFNLASLRGKVIVLNFWFIACKPCIAEIPALNELQQAFSKQDVVFLAITFDKNQPVKNFLKTHPYNYTIVPGAKAYLDLWKAQVFPANIVIDKKGVVRYHHFGNDVDIEKTLTDNINSLI